MNFYKNFTPFQKGFFLFFTVVTIVFFLLPGFVHSQQWKDIFDVIGIIGLISTLSGVLNSIYIARADITCYFWWILNTLTYAATAYVGHLYGQVIQNIVFIFPLEVIGFLAWRRNLKQKEAQNQDAEIDVKKFGTKEWILTIVGLAIFWIAYAIFLKELPTIFKSVFNITIAPDAEYIIDSLTAITTIYAVWLTGARYIEQWTFWIISNGIGIIMFLIPLVQDLMHHNLSVSTISGTIMWIQYGTSAVYGFVCWRKLYKERNIKEKQNEKIQTELS